MGKKYIIELEDKPFHKEGGDFLYRVKGFNSLVFDITGVGKLTPRNQISAEIIPEESLTPYNEPDTEAIRKEAYSDGFQAGSANTSVVLTEGTAKKIRQEGYDKGFSDAMYNCHESCAFLDDAKKEAYQRGYETAKHECEDCNANAVKIADDKAHEAYQKGYENGFVAGHLKAEKSGQSFYEDGYQRGLSDAWNAARKIWEYDTTTLREIFGEGIMRMDWFMKFTASEAIEKIWQYEQRQEMDGLRQNIQTIVDQCGYTLDEIAEVLQKMKE